MKLLYEGTFEYGWSHSGITSWGANWHVNACNIALEQIRRRVASMVNLKELEAFVKTDLKRDIAGEGSESEDSSSFKISHSENKSNEWKENWVNENNYLIDVKNVRIKSGTDWADGEDNRPFGGRTWNASATMECDLQISGKE